jgi:hemolysin III
MPIMGTPRLRGVSHQLAFFTAVGAGLVLVAMAASARTAAAAGIYAASLAAMFGVSAAYHRGRWAPAARLRWRRADHATIFLAIAGTYTPICLLVISGSHLLGLVWAGALAGMLQAVLWPRAPRALAALLYCGLGWIGVTQYEEVRDTLASGSLILLVAGGVLYSAGAVVYARKRPDPRPSVFGFHEVFHALVIAASICHFAVVLQIIRTVR